MKSIFVLCLILSLVVVGKSEPENDIGSGDGNNDGGSGGSNGGAGSSGSPSCYINCLMNDCRKSVFQCALCLGKCAIAEAEFNSVRGRQMSNRDFCNIGCSTSLCTKLALPNNQYTDVASEKEVKGCVNSCSRRCTDNMY